MAPRRKKKLSDQIRDAIDDSGKSRYRISHESEIDESALAKFYNGLSMKALDRLAECLGMRIEVEGRKQTKGR